MSAAAIPLPRPRYSGPLALFREMGAIGAVAVVTRLSDAVRLDFQVPVSRQPRAEVLIGDRAAWDLNRWAECAALAFVLTSEGERVACANDDVRTFDLGRLVQASAGEPVALLHFGVAAVDTPAALFRALRVIGGVVILRRDQHGLGLGFMAPGRREQRLDALLGSIASHDGDWWLEAVAELGRIFPFAGSPLTMRPGEVRRLALAGRPIP